MNYAVFLFHLPDFFHTASMSFLEGKGVESPHFFDWTSYHHSGPSFLAKKGSAFTHSPWRTSVA